MSTQISKCVFSLGPVRESYYDLSIKFLNGEDEVLSTKKFTFSQQKKEDGKLSYEKARTGKKDAFEDTLLDVYSQNGVCGPKILSSLFLKRDEQGIRRATAMMNEKAFKARTILVLDLQDPKTGYKENSDETIAKCERAVCDFFKSKSLSSEASKHAKKIHKNLALDFLLLEGSLKMDLLKYGGFSDSEIDYFHTSSGAKVLCQCTEFFINAFKMGEIAQGEKEGVLLADKYIVPISDQFTSFMPCIKSVVYLPPQYREMYAEDGIFAKKLKEAFAVSVTYDTSSKITIMNVTRK
jgi:hypothetical protein